MSKIRLHGTSSGYTEIAPVAASGNNTLTLPNDGTIISKDSNGAVGVTSIKSSNVNVGAAVTITESGIEASGIGITCANINGTQIGGRRNLVINGAMTVAQRGTSSTSNGYQTVDRYNMNSSGHDEAPTQSQADVSSGTSPYAEGFRKSLKITNGNQTSGAGAADRLRILYIIEAQDMANSGWNYTDSNSKVTLSFWIKSSVAQNFYFRATTSDGTSQNFPMETGALTANTWTKITKTIPGNSNLQFDNNNGIGFYLIFALMRGTDNTDSGVALNTWAATSSGVTLYPDFTTTWWTTNDATWEMTGLQLEVGSQATPFEHRSFGEELALCQRYFCRFQPATGFINYGVGGAYTNTQAVAQIHFPVSMRAYPTFSYNGALNTFYDIVGSFSSFSSMTMTQAMGSSATGYQWANIQVVGSGTAGNTFLLATLNNTNTYIDFNSEL